jgi:hypothetical protein
MKRLQIVSLTLAALVANVARAGEDGVGRYTGNEASPGECRDGVDNDRNGLTDCEDPKCQGIAGCGPAPWMLPRASRVTPTEQMGAGVAVMVLGVGLAGASGAVFANAWSSANESRTVSLVAAGVMGAASLAITVAGALVLRRGIVRHAEDVAMGLARAPRLQLDPLLALDARAGSAGLRLRF